MEILENIGIPYNINWTESKSVSIKINKNGLRLNIGENVPKEFIDSFLSKKKFWIKDNWQKYESARNTYLYLGKETDGPIDEKYYRNEFHLETKTITEKEIPSTDRISENP